MYMLGFCKVLDTGSYDKGFTVVCGIGPSQMALFVVGWSVGILHNET